MKKVSFILLCLFLVLIACDKVKDPYQHNPNTVNDSTKYVRKVLLEEYTGHTCGNCPDGSIEAERLQDEYKGNLVVIAVHAGSFAKTETEYPTSYTTTTGNDWNGTAGFSIPGNPAGIIDRKDYGSGLALLASGAWAPAVSQAFLEPYVLGLTINPAYSAASRILNINIKAKFKTTYDKAMKLSVILTEDSIIGDQKYYDRSNNTVHIPNYVFMNMLRGSINGSWGDTLKKLSGTAILANDSIVRSFPNFAIDPKFNDKHLYVVAFAYNSETREVLQVERAKIR